MPYRLKFNTVGCVGCYACHTACLDANHGAEEIHARSFRTIRKVTDEEKGFSYEICPGCTHCGACEKVCPNHVIFLDKNKKAAKCDGCIERLKEGREPACVSVCCLDVITLERE